MNDEDWAFEVAMGIVVRHESNEPVDKACLVKKIASALRAERKRNRDIAFSYAQGDERSEDGDCGRVPYEIVKTIEMVEYPCDVCQGKGKLDQPPRVVDCPMCGGSGNRFR